MEKGVCNMMYIDCALNRRAACQQHPGGFSLPSDIVPSISPSFSLPPLLVPLLSFCVFPASLFVLSHWLKILAGPVTITDHLRENVLPAVDSV